MRRRKLLVAGLVVTLTGLSACSSHQLRWTGAVLARGTVDSLLGFPAASVVTGAGDVLAEGNANAHEREVAALSDAYSDFVTDRHSPDLSMPAARSVLFDPTERTHANASD